MCFALFFNGAQVPVNSNKYIPHLDITTSSKLDQSVQLFSECSAYIVLGALFY